MFKASRFLQKARGMTKDAQEAAKRHPVAVASLVVASIATAMGLVNPAEVMAWSTPAQNSFAYDVYDIAVNKLLNGPIGFVVGMSCMGAGGYFVANSRAGGMGAGIPMILLGGALIKLDSITNSLGYSF